MHQNYLILFSYFQQVLNISFLICIELLKGGIKMNKKILFAGLAAIVLGATAGKAQVPSYVYTDDFSTDKVEQDSYNHSPLLEETPPDGSPAYLKLIDEEVNRRLGFFQGTPDPRAKLNYLMPLNEQHYIYNGTLEFDAIAHEGAIFPQLFIGITDDLDSAYNLYVISSSQHCEFPIPSGRNMHILFEGKGMAIDNLKVEMCYDDPIPDQKTTWGELKGQYR